ncbi:sulfotransferase [Frankia sp. CNm7]|uniref:Sulfotransferase n=1 Tax=Frankia nepalensis TaxID=1836974 RepID=A0A937RRJ1_9ACTN|nr:sulfotransferase [Frankia nepalensis]MBL7501187.1 sulfotransferase [Frankia nepalensis]MBL7515731.1 sulfotransferase [Frankia nepalensis]MBL7521799.1 sulfotransferase [Frankia nepalensis]MBL7631403.1 sulfotransferase [Frankia nepalensis]
MSLPDFLVIGVPKAGTTAMHAALSRHPELFLPAVKEPKFFLSEGPPPARGGPGDAQTYQEHVWRRADYEALFDPAPAGALRGEATPFYLYDLDAQNRIKRLLPKAKLIVLLRNPVDRAHSNWTHLWAAGLESERDFVRACALEQSRREAGWAHFWHYVSQGRYGAQLAHLLGLFSRDQVLLLRYRELREEPVATLDKVCDFLGVATGLLERAPSENVTPYVADTQVNTVLRHILRTGGQIGHHFPVRVRETARAPFLAALQRQKGGRRPLSPEERAAVLPYFVEDIALLEEVTGLSYADWLTTGIEPDIVDDGS